MKVLEIVGITVIPVLIGLVIRIIVRKKPKAQLVIWAFIMTYMLAGFIVSLVLVLKQETPLFTKHHMAEEIFVVVTAGFMGTGTYYFRKNRKYLTGKNDDKEIKPRGKGD
jgi:O-antigen/teichoic acid export membrane protein